MTARTEAPPLTLSALDDAICHLAAMMAQRCDLDRRDREAIRLVLFALERKTETIAKVLAALGIARTVTP